MEQMWYLKKSANKTQWPAFQGIFPYFMLLPWQMIIFGFKCVFPAAVFSFQKPIKKTTQLVVVQLMERLGSWRKMCIWQIITLKNNLIITYVLLNSHCSDLLVSDMSLVHEPWLKKEICKDWVMKQNEVCNDKCNDDDSIFINCQRKKKMLDLWQVWGFAGWSIQLLMNNIMKTEIIFEVFVGAK